MGLLNQVYLTNDLMKWAYQLNDFVYWEWWISSEATRTCYFGLALSGIGSQSARLSDILNLKSLKTIRYQVYFLLPLKLQEYTILSYSAKCSWPISLQDFLLLLLLVNLNTGDPLLHCICWFSSMWIGFEANNDDT